MDFETAVCGVLFSQAYMAQQEDRPPGVAAIGSLLCPDAMDAPGKEA